MKLRTAPRAAAFLEQYAASLPHAQLLTGPIGVGLFTFAIQLAEANGRVLSVLRPEAKTASSLPAISTERIRGLYTDTRSRMDGAHFVIIDDADTMNAIAQNALLKLLEEPTDSVRFILTSHKPENILPTIRSRVQHFAIPRLPTLESKRLLKALGVSDELTERRLLFVADGLPAELTRLVGSESDFKQLLERVQSARQLASGSAYERLIAAHAIKDDRQASLNLIDTAVMLLRRSLTNNADAATLSRIEAMLDASERIKANGNIRLHLIAAVLQ